MDPISAPLEVVDAVDVRPGAIADAVVIAAWTDHHAEIYGFLVRTTRDPGVAEDLLQEAFLRLTREVRANRTPDNVRALAVPRRGKPRSQPWTADHVGIPRHRPSLRHPLRLTEPRTPRRSGTSSAKAERTLVDALDALRPAARAALLMSSEGFTGREIAAAIGRTETATRTMLCRARLQVRNRLSNPEPSR